MRTERLLRQTRIHFPRFDLDEIKITPIEKGGSDRKFYRIRCSTEKTLILVKYNLEREENRHYVEIAQFLEAHQIRGPKIYFHDPAEGLIWIEDLGQEDLFSHRRETWVVRRAFYQSALDEIGKLHRLPEAVCQQMRSKLPAEFNAPLYLWEQSYFFENCLGRYFKMESAALAALAELPRLKEIAAQLGNLPRVLVHRDFQSQNIIMRSGQACLIDFQGMRPGLPQYDLASLLYDPYVDLSQTERAELIEHYCGTSPGGDFIHTLHLCAMQRLMQALGAYGFLGLIKGHTQFLEYIPSALHSLRAVLKRIENLDPLEKALPRLEPAAAQVRGDDLKLRSNAPDFVPSNPANKQRLL